MLSSLPNLADKAFILGFLMPVLLLFAGLLGLFADSEPVSALLAVATKQGGIENFAYGILVVWAVAVLLMLINHYLIRLLEGYIPPVSTIGWFKNRQRTRYLDLKQQEAATHTRRDELAIEARLTAEYDSTDVALAVAQRLADAKSAFNKVSQELFLSFPAQEGWLLPTRLGNAIRAFETYSNSVYGADSIPLWPRLLTIIPSDFRTMLDDARAEVNFLVNMVLVAILLAVAAAARWAAEIRWLAPALKDPAPDLAWMYARTEVGLLVATGLLLLAAWGFYRWAILRAQAWGELVRTAFDCYLPDLAKKLGYALPPAGADQRRFWAAIAGQAIYGDAFDPARWPRAAGNDHGA